MAWKESGEEDASALSLLAAFDAVPAAEAVAAATAAELAHVRVLFAKAVYDVIFDLDATVRQFKLHIEGLCEVPAHMQKLSGAKGRA